MLPPLLIYSSDTLNSCKHDLPSFFGLAELLLFYITPEALTTKENTRTIIAKSYLFKKGVNYDISKE